VNFKVCKEAAVRLEYYHVDAFTEEAFSGNPAVVCFLDEWLPDDVMQKIALENGVSETAFLVKGTNDYRIRWFTPKVEVDLCGHATLASAHVLFHHKGVSDEAVHFISNADTLIVQDTGSMLVLNFPARPPVPCVAPPELAAALGQIPLEVLASRDYLVLLPSESSVRSLEPDMVLLRRLDRFGLIVTAKGEQADFVSRFFCPAEGIPEDPVTGSAHCTLIPFWAKKLGKSSLNALQVSPRGGRLYCQYLGDRVRIGGQAVTYSQGFIEF
jgi:predicted PhzF superfamily epimerase YddE/YHI9